MKVTVRGQWLQKRLQSRPSEPARAWRRALPENDVRTVAEMGWGSIKNGKLLKLVEDGQFDVP